MRSAASPFVASSFRNLSLPMRKPLIRESSHRPRESGRVSSVPGFVASSFRNLGLDEESRNAGEQPAAAREPGVSSVPGFVASSFRNLRLDDERMREASRRTVICHTDEFGFGVWQNDHAWLLSRIAQARESSCDGAQATKRRHPLIGAGACASMRPSAPAIPARGNRRGHHRSLLLGLVHGFERQQGLHGGDDQDGVAGLQQDLASGLTLTPLRLAA